MKPVDPIHRASRLALCILLSACVVHEVHEAPPPSGGGGTATPNPIAFGRLALRGEVQPGSGVQGTLSEAESEAVAYAFVGRAGPR
jgi:hypothetical protein